MSDEQQTEWKLHGVKGTPSETVHVLVQIGHGGRVYVRVSQDPTWPNDPIAELTVMAAVTTRKDG
jgi:hypothetical protein